MANSKLTTASYDLWQPSEQLFPLVVDSPHSWSENPADFRPVCAKKDLLTSWDAWVDELFSSIVKLGAPLLSARFPRFFLDLNRGRDDIDLAMIDGALPFPVNPTAKSQKGFGLLRRNALPGVYVYNELIPAERVVRDIETYYDPYNLALQSVIEATYEKFGRSVHLDCHSMKSRGNAMNDDPGQLRPDIVVSDTFGETSDPAITHFLAECFSNAGLTAQVNDPYQGAELIRKFSDPAKGRHSIQIELNRALYMDEKAFTKLPMGFPKLQSQISRILESFAKGI